MNEIVVGQSDITAAQMKDFWRQVGDGSITRPYLQSFLECPLEKRKPVKAEVTVEIAEPSIIIPTFRSTGPTLAEWLKAREELHKFFTGETIVLTDLFALTPEELASATLMPAFRPAGATNRQAVDWKLKIGETTPFEEVDVMKYKNSNGSKEHELYLLNRSTEPDTDTLGKNAKSPNNLILVKDKLWIGLFLWADADTLHRAITGSPLDPNTWCWFPHDRLPGGKVACGYSGGGRSQFSWYYAVSCYPNYGARSAKKVPRKS